VPHPNIIRFDSDLLKKDGREVLADIETDEVLKGISVVVLTTSKDEHDILKDCHL